jgi:hypothetical protein
MALRHATWLGVAAGREVAAAVSGGLSGPEEQPAALSTASRKGEKRVSEGRKRVFME